MGRSLRALQSCACERSRDEAPPTLRHPRYAFVNELFLTLVFSGEKHENTSVFGKVWKITLADKGESL